MHAPDCTTILTERMQVMKWPTAQSDIKRVEYQCTQCKAKFFVDKPA